MLLLADVLATPGWPNRVRSHAAWEQAASLRLRDGDSSSSLA
jgi:hypothetical protein